MVLESILRPKNAEDKPWHVVVIAFIYTVISVFFSQKLFPSQSSMLSMALITFLFVPFFQKMFVLEEKKEKFSAGSSLLARHEKSIVVFSAFFFGVILATSFMFIFFPDYNSAFLLQSDTIKGFTGFATQDGDFMKFFLNNSKVMLLMFILAALWGAGSIMILAWNASVIGVYIGIFIQSIAPVGSVQSFVYGFPVALGSLAIHGVPEVMAYFLAGLAGGILSVGIIREDIASSDFKRIFRDSLIFLASAEVLIIAAAWLEAFV